MNSKISSYRVSPEPFNKSLEVPSSKSYSNRILILAALCPRPIIIKNISNSTDVETMMTCLKKVGLVIEKLSDNDFLVENSFPACERNIAEPLILNTGDGGTTNRFLIPLLGLGKKKYLIEAAAGMRGRPMEELVTALRLLGSDCHQSTESWMSIKGPFKKELTEITVNCRQTTQFLTGLSMALYFYKTKVISKDLTTSKSYYEMTLELIDQIKSGVSEFIVPVDFSSLAYPLTLGALSGGATIVNCLSIDPFQADSVIVRILHNMGATSRQTDQGLFIVGGQALWALDFDCSDCPDLVPTLAFLCAYAEGISYLRNIKVLKYKECDRISETLKIMEIFNIKCAYNEAEDFLEIIGPSQKQEESVHYAAPVDHRMIMLSYLFMRKNSGGDIVGVEHVKKSFPGFFEAMK